MLRRLAVLIAIGAAGTAMAWVARHRVARVLDRIEEKSGIAASITSAAASVGPRGRLDVHAETPGPHPRILLTPARLARVAALRDRGAPSWALLLSECHASRDHNIPAGYEGWDWVQAALALGICAKVTNDPELAAAGVRYLKALLDDKASVGDGAGGDTVVRHDDGYPIRTHGAFAAIAYDWLHDAPGMTPALRKKAMDRLLAWTKWFEEKGFEHDQPISNYYVSYFGAVAFGGIALEGDDPRADVLRRRTEEMWNRELVPTYGAKLQGGDYPEGWQYGENVGVLLTLFADAEPASHPNGAAQNLLFQDLPWLRETVALRAHALHPDGKHIYDNGDWSEKPAVAPAHMMEALSTVLPSSDLAGRQATYLARIAVLANKDTKDADTWLRVLADDPARPAEDPRTGQASYLSPGTATVFARSDYSVGSIWSSLTFEPSLSPHEHRDAGHFEIIRGSDPLFIDPGGYESFSSFGHNVVIVDDPLQSSDYDTSAQQHPIITYKGIQGGWSYTSHVARFEDGGGYVYALGSYDSAFNPFGFPEERKDRAVTRAEREWLYSRTPATGAGPGESGRFVIYDRLTFTDPRFTAMFVLHGGLAPQITGPVARFTTGASSGWVTTLLPKGAITSVVDETHNTPSNDRVFFTNVPADGVTSFRYQVAYPAALPQDVERRFLHTIVVGAAGPPPAKATPIAIEGPQVAGAAIDGEAYVFSSVGPAGVAVPVAYRAPATATRHLVLDLAPLAQYAAQAVSDGDGCKVTLTPGAGKVASPQGVLSLDVSGCSVR